MFCRTRAELIVSGIVGESGYVPVPGCQGVMVTCKSNDGMLPQVLAQSRHEESRWCSFSS